MDKVHTTVCVLASESRGDTQEDACLCSLDRAAVQLAEDDFAFAAEMQEETDSAGIDIGDDDEGYDFYQDDLNFDAARERGYR